MDGWMDGWMDGLMDGWMDGRIDGLDGWMDGWVDGWMDGWMDGWTGGWMDGWIYVRAYARFYARYIKVRVVGTLSAMRLTDEDELDMKILCIDLRHQTFVPISCFSDVPRHYCLALWGSRPGWLRT